MEKEKKESKKPEKFNSGQLPFSIIPEKNETFLNYQKQNSICNEPFWFFFFQHIYIYIYISSGCSHVIIVRTQL